MKAFSKNKLGFSLLEMSIVLAVVAVAVSSGVLVFSKYSAESKTAQTELTMKQVMTAVKKYVLRFGELPCPADPTLTYSQSGFGFGVDPGTCTNSVSKGGNVVAGMVPVSSLNIYPSLAVDAWGNRFTYVVINTATSDNALCTPTSNTAQPCESPSYSASTDTVLNLANIGARNYSAAYSGYISGDVLVLLISHGENGYGSYSGRGSSAVTDYSLATGDEQKNADTEPEFVASTPYRGFDDIIYFWTFDQLTNSDVME